MSSIKIINILEVLKKSNDKNIILKALVQLRTDIVKDREGIILLKDSQGIAPLIKFLNRPHEKILEVVLSILGNACTNQDCCSEAFELKIVPPLVTILKSVPNPSIQCRACRLLGNLAKENKEKFSNYIASIAQSLCLIIEESSEYQTILMATRAAKFFLCDKQFLKHFVNYDGCKIIMKIAIKFMKNNEEDIMTNNKIEDIKPTGLKVQEHKEKYFQEVARHLEGVRSDIFDYEFLKKEKKPILFIMPNEKEQIDIVYEILKCVQIVSEYQFKESTLELYNTSLSLPCIVFFANDSNPFRYISLRIISNFARNPYAISALSQADAVVSACDLLMATNLKNSLSESELKYCINIINVLSCDACNRAKIRRSGALKKLLQIARNSTSYTEISLILFLLNNFQYDNMSISFMLREGLVGILIKELDAYLNTKDEHRKKKVEDKILATQVKKRKSATEVCQPCNKTPRMWEEFDEDSPIGSPTNYSPSSPCSSRSLSPISNCSKTLLGNDFDSETYSPVCSEDEVDSEDENNIGSKDKPTDDCEVMKLLDIAFKSENSLEQNVSDKEEEDEKKYDNSNEKILNRSAIDIIDNLLFRVSHLVANRGELGKAETLKTIIQAINVFGINSNCFGNCLTNILSESQFFMSTIKQDVIHQLYKMTKVEDLKFGGINFIDTLTCVAETGYGRGEIIKLLKLEDCTKKRAATAVAIIIKNPRFLYNFLTEHDVLNILLTTVLNKNDEYRIEAADAITSLAQTLRITSPVCDINNFAAIKEFDESLDFIENHSDTDEMKFLIHRGCSQIPIKFDRKLLSENSEVFNSMLNSDFREKKEGEVHLKNYTVHGIKYFLNLIKLKSSDQQLNIPPVYHFDSILEAYELSRMYIMPELEKKLFSMLIYRLCSKSCLQVFEWSLTNFNQELSEIAINYYLCSDIDGEKKLELFREADYSKYSKEWYQMITEAILVKCQNLSNDFI